VCGLSAAPFDPTIKTLLGVCPQHDKTYPSLTVREHLELFARIKCTENVPDAVKTALADMALEPVANVRVAKLSGGNRRRLSIGIACLGRPKVVILDGTLCGHFLFTCLLFFLFFIVLIVGPSSTPHFPLHFDSNRLQVLRTT
jgi:ABC-type branched-subunit amino acid transport system ATPase component